MNKIERSVVVYCALIVIVFGAIWNIFDNSRNQLQLDTSSADFSQPELTYGIYPWSVRSIDTQVISKHWPDVNQMAVAEQVAMIKGLGVNYVAIGTPYDRVEDMTLWVDEIHKAGLHVWFRSHWAQWEGDDGQPSTLSAEDYLKQTKQFILDHPELFREGDAFTVAVEAEQVGVGLGKRFLTWDDYREFLLLEIAVANDAFAQIGLEGKVYTNWLSMNGWIVENQLTQEVVDVMDLIVVDHFVGQSSTIGELNDPDEIVSTTIADLDRMYDKWQKPILLGEWGYQIFQEVSDDLQAEVVDKMYRELVNKDYLVGVNYWVHMGNSASLISDEFGSNLKYREAALVVENYFDPLEVIPDFDPSISDSVDIE